MNAVPDGWKINDTSNGNRMLFKFFKADSLKESFKRSSEISPVILDSGYAGQINLSLSNDFVTISLNDLGQENNIEQYYPLANKLNAAFDNQ